MDQISGSVVLFKWKPMLDAKRRRGFDPSLRAANQIAGRISTCRGLLFGETLCVPSQVVCNSHDLQPTRTVVFSHIPDA